MPPLKKRSPRRSTIGGKIQKGVGRSKTPCRSVYWTRRKALPRLESPVFAPRPPKRRPLIPSVIRVNRLIPLRPEGTLKEASKRHNTIDALRELCEANKSDMSVGYYATALQGEVLDVPLKLCMERERAVLKALPGRFFMNFSKPVNEAQSHLDGLATHPLEYGKLSCALGHHKDLFESDRTIPKAPYKVLDAPELKDDFYFNLIDWSSKNVLSVGLGSAVYLWRAADGHVEELYSREGENGEVSSVGWSQGASALAVGNCIGKLQLWDPVTKQKIIQFQGHTNRVGSLSWNLNKLASGCRDGSIRYFDHRHNNPVCVITGHRSEVCGLKWSSNNFYLASGGNDNRVNVWDIRRTEEPLWKITEHTAAVRAISWSPHNSKHFVTGGGLKDVHIKMWNMNTMERIMNVNTYAQVCGLHWSENANEIVSTHGYKNNTIQLWKASNMECLGTVPCHKSRIVYLTTSPDGQSIATGSGDESIRFFKVFPPANSRRHLRGAQRDKIHLCVR